jgi:DNA mismatch repair ATPase MutL
MKHKPAYVININLPTTSYDINLSPDKREIAINGESIILETLKTALDSLYAPSRNTFAVSQGNGRRASDVISLFSSQTPPIESIRSEGDSEDMDESGLETLLASQSAGPPVEEEIETEDMSTDVTNDANTQNGLNGDDDERVMFTREIVWATEPEISNLASPASVSQMQRLSEFKRPASTSSNGSSHREEKKRKASSATIGTLPTAQLQRTLPLLGAWGVEQVTSSDREQVRAVVEESAGETSKRKKVEYRQTISHSESITSDSTSSLLRTGHMGRWLHSLAHTDGDGTTDNHAADDVHHVLKAVAARSAQDGAHGAVPPSKSKGSSRILQKEVTCRSRRLQHPC